MPLRCRLAASGPVYDAFAAGFRFSLRAASGLGGLGKISEACVVGIEGAGTEHEPVAALGQM